MEEQIKIFRDLTYRMSQNELGSECKELIEVRLTLIELVFPQHYCPARSSTF